jgi:hypothetical protein
MFESAMSNKTSTTTNSDLDLLLNNTPPKIVSLLTSLLIIVVISPLYFAIIWFERFGNSLKRTLVNQLFAFVCWIFLVYLTLLKTFDIIIALIAPLPAWICYIHAFFKSLSSILIMSTIDLIFITRYLFIFKIQNPASLEDDFWNYFLCLWTTGFSIVSQFVFFFWPGLQPVHIYVCTGESPSENIPLKQRWSAIFTAAGSLILVFALLIRIEVHKRKIRPEVRRRFRIMCCLG